jgi:hypothetical protein
MSRVSHVVAGATKPGREKTALPGFLQHPASVKLPVQEGVDPSMLSAAGYSLYDPVASNASAEGQAKNRRIEITLVPQVAQLLDAADAKKP